MSGQAIHKTIEFIRQVAGIVLTPEKAYFVEARLAPVLREEKLANLDELLLKAERGDRRLHQRMVDTNATITSTTLNSTSVKPVWRLYVFFRVE